MDIQFMNLLIITMEFQCKTFLGIWSKLDTSEKQNSHNNFMWELKQIKNLWLVYIMLNYKYNSKILIFLSTHLIFGLLLLILVIPMIVQQQDSILYQMENYLMILLLMLAWVLSVRHKDFGVIILMMFVKPLFVDSQRTNFY